LKKLRSDNSQNERLRSIFSISHSIFFSLITDRSILLENENSIININERANPRNLKRKQKLHRDFNSRISILLFYPEKRNSDENDGQHENSINKIINN
jgi:hypothetical protein